VLLRQRHFQLLGRSIDLNHLVAQRINTYLRQNIDYAISRFEAADITAVIDLEVRPTLFPLERDLTLTRTAQMHLQNIRYTHHLLSKYFELDPWENLFNEANESTSIVSMHGRIVLHVIFEMIYDFFPNWNYNGITQRFTRTVLSFAEEVPRETPPKPRIQFLYGNKSLNAAYAHAAELTRKYFGMAHVLALLRLIGRTNLALVVSECLNNLELKLHNVLAPYMRELNAGMPPSSKLPIYDYGTAGCFGYFQLKLKDIISYSELRSEVFQHFKEFGNTIILLLLLDQGLALLDTHTFLQSAPFLGITPEQVPAHLRRLPTFLPPFPSLPFPSLPLLLFVFAND
jgi:cytoplasmic FMR1 interacting protein